MQQVGSGVVVHGVEALLPIYLSGKFHFYILGQGLGIMHDKVIVFFGIYNLYHFFAKNQYTLVAHLTTTFCIEWGAGQYYLVLLFVFGFYLSVAAHFGLDIQIIITHKLVSRLFVYDNPVARIYGCGRSGTVFLLGHFLCEAGFIHCKIMLSGNKSGEVYRETVSIQ